MLSDPKMTAHVGLQLRTFWSSVVTRFKGAFKYISRVNFPMRDEVRLELSGKPTEVTEVRPGIGMYYHVLVKCVLEFEFLTTVRALMVFLLCMAFYMCIQVVSGAKCHMA